MLGIVVITYNSQKYLPHLLDTLYRQSYTNWKLILVDNGSDDILWPEYEKKVLNGEKGSFIAAGELINKFNNL